MKFYKIFLITFLLISCKKSIDYNHYFRNLVFRTLDDQIFRIEEIKTKGIIINFYSPTCLPCIEELPALHLLYSESENFNFSMFLAVESSLEKHLPEIPDGFDELNFDEKSKNLLIQVLRKEIQQRNIQIPMILVDRPFRIDSDQMITGTPETLFFSTNPLNLHYNIVGPITNQTNQELIRKDSKYIFARNLIQAISGESP